MKILKKFTLCLLATVISSYTYADIIELDAMNPDHCRQQILSSTDELPIIAAYSSNSYDEQSASFMKKFEVLAKEHPERTFFKWDAEKDMVHLTQTLCIQQSGLSAQPNLIMLGVFTNGSNGTFMSSPFRLSWAGEMTMVEMNKFIDISDLNMKKAILKQKSRH